MRSADSSTSPSDSMRFLPTSIAHGRRVLEQSVADELRRATKDLQALPPRGCGPGGLGTARRRDRLVDVRRRAAGERPEEDLRIDRRAGFERPDAVPPGAIDVVPVDGAELAADLGRGLLEAGVQILVVGAQCGVRDLDARLGLGRHSGSLVRRWVGIVAVSLRRVAAAAGHRRPQKDRRTRPRRGCPRSS